jgi:hypothetical protein
MLAMVGQSQNRGIGAFNTLFGKPARDHFSAHTDAAGHFRLENFPATATAMLAVETPGKVLHPADQESDNFEEAGYRAGQADIKLLVEPAGGIEGRIVDGENNQPLPAARVVLQPDDSRGFAMAGTTPAKSDTNGVFHFDKVLAGSYRVQVLFGTNNDAGWVAEMVPVAVTAGQTTQGERHRVQRRIPVARYFRQQWRGKNVFATGGLSGLGIPAAATGVRPGFRHGGGRQDQPRGN